MHIFQNRIDLIWSVLLKQNLRCIFQKYELHIKNVLSTMVPIRFFIKWPRCLDLLCNAVYETLYLHATTIGKEVELLGTLSSGYVSLLSFWMFLLLENKIWLEDACYVFT